MQVKRLQRVILDDGSKGEFDKPLIPETHPLYIKYNMRKERVANTFTNNPPSMIATTLEKPWDISNHIKSINLSKEYKDLNGDILSLCQKLLCTYPYLGIKLFPYGVVDLSDMCVGYKDSGFLTSTTRTGALASNIEDTCKSDNAEFVWGMFQYYHKADPFSPLGSVELVVFEDLDGNEPNVLGYQVSSTAIQKGGKQRQRYGMDAHTKDTKKQSSALKLIKDTMSEYAQPDLSLGRSICIPRNPRSGTGRWSGIKPFTNVDIRSFLRSTLCSEVGNLISRGRISGVDMEEEVVNMSKVKYQAVTERFKELLDRYNTHIESVTKYKKYQPTLFHILHNQHINRWEVGEYVLPKPVAGIWGYEDTYEVGDINVRTYDSFEDLPEDIAGKIAMLNIDDKDRFHMHVGWKVSPIRWWVTDV